MPSNQKNELKKLKINIKLWEVEFLKKNSKKPDKNDIQEAPKEIKEGYRKYWKLKSSIPSESEDIKQDVWSQSLNKQNIKTSISTPHTPKVNVYCEKMKQHSKLVPFEPKTLITAQDIKPNDIVFNDHCIQSSEFDTGIQKNESSTERSCDPLDIIQFKSQRSFSRVIKSDTVYSKSNNISVLTPYCDTAKRLHMKQNMDEDWFKRCDDSLIKEVVETSKLTNFNHVEKSSVSSVHNELVPVNVDSTSDCGESRNKTEKIPIPSKLESFQDVSYTSESATNLKINDFSNPTALKSPVSVEVSSSASEHQLLNNTTSEILHEVDTNDVENVPLSVSEDLVKRKSVKRKLDKSIMINENSNSSREIHLKKKISSGTVNENFIRLNIKKKKFSRGHRFINVKKLKWNKWKQLKNNSGSLPYAPTNLKGCFKCGEFGHWARNCTVSAAKEEKNGFEEIEVDDVPLPTLEEASKLAHERKNSLSKPFSSTSLHSQTVKDQDLSNKDTNEVDDNVISNNTQYSQIIRPLYEPTALGKAIATPKEVFSALKDLGFSHFRNGQEEAIMRVLCGLSTLIVLPTGSGKSLCYQLPAYMYAKHIKSIVLVVSPLVSLMEDQILGLSTCLRAVCLHSGMTEAQKSLAMKDISSGAAQILLVSPEAVIGSYSLADAIVNSTIPPIAFACIDEVHCISQWSHNFRPSYLQLYKVLTQKFNVKCILGLTATATQSTVEDILLHLGLNFLDDSVIGSTNVPPNLLLSISRDKDRDKALIQLLNGDRFGKCGSIIIYCIRRAETERLAALIRTCLQDQLVSSDLEPNPKRKKLNSKKRNFAWTAEAYHAGLAPPKRRSVQKRFMSGKLRVVVATVAFGMGLDKSDVRAIVHYNMPKTFESYVQEIGRSGRDGLQSHCHLFLDNEGHDLRELQRHIFANSTDRHTLRKLLKRVFVSCKCKSANLEIEELNTDMVLQKEECPKHEVAFPINETVQELDMKQENISTLLCYLELHSKHWIEILSPTYATCTIRCYGGPKQMHEIALKNPTVAAAMALDAQNGRKWDKSMSYTFSIVQVASAIGIKSSVLKQDLKRLEWKDKRKTGAIVEFSDLSFHISAPGNLSDAELDEVLDFLYGKVKEIEEDELKNLRKLFSIFQKNSFSHYWECSDEIDSDKSSSIKEKIHEYFSNNNLLSNVIEEETDEIRDKIDNEVDSEYIRRLVKEIIGTHHDQTFTGRAIGRIFHGIESPCYPLEIWGKVRRFWRCLLSVDFNLIIKLANEELRNTR